MMFNGMLQRPRQDFGMRHQSLGERPDFDMGGGIGRQFNGIPGYDSSGINPGGMYTGGNQRPMPQIGGHQMPMQNPRMTGGNQQPMSQSPLMALWQQYMRNRRFG